jgi:hypothetical protein
MGKLVALGDCLECYTFERCWVWISGGIFVIFGGFCKIVRGSAGMRPVHCALIYRLKDELRLADTDDLARWPFLFAYIDWLWCPHWGWGCSPLTETNNLYVLKKAVAITFYKISGMLVLAFVDEFCWLVWFLGGVVINRRFWLRLRIVASFTFQLFHFCYSDWRCFIAAPFCRDLNLT